MNGIIISILFAVEKKKHTKNKLCASAVRRHSVVLYGSICVLQWDNALAGENVNARERFIVKFNNNNHIWFFLLFEETFWLSQSLWYRSW